MCKIRPVLLLALLALQIPVIYCNPWWSIVSGAGVFNSDNPITPIKLRCDRQDFLLSDQQRILCRSYGDKLLSTVAIGILQALNECQKLFKDRPWNCSVFDSRIHYLGRFTEIGTRETAFLNAIISAGIAREIARKCKEQELPTCNCDFSVRGSTSEESRNISGCGDNCQFGVSVAELFTDVGLTNNNCVTLTELHNNNVGRLLVKNTSVACVCHGLSGSCSVRTCFKKVPDIDEVGQQLFKLYYIAKRVKQVGTTLKPVKTNGPPLTDKELAYCEFSPDFCNRNLTYGIYGTSNRRCYPNENGPSSCSSLCCGKPAVSRIIKLKENPVDCCKFVWCCRLDCSKCGTYDVIQYYCP